MASVTLQQAIKALAEQAEVGAMLEAIAGGAGRTIEEAIEIQQIPAPTFEEGARAAYLRDGLAACGLDDVEVDGQHVVYGRLAGTDSGTPAVLLVAHLDTVFAADTDLTVRRQEERIYGPGLGDNSVAVAALLALGRAFQAQGWRPAADIWLVGTAGEEGLGDLLGMQRAMERLNDRVGVVLVVEGMALGNVFHGGLSVRRLRVTLDGPGGHSWLNFGRASAIHSLLRLGAELTRVQVPLKARSSLNIGLINGGTSINTIASQASLSLDLRSEDPKMLGRLERRVRKAIEGFNLPDGLQLEAEVIGDRPGAQIPRAHPLVQASGAVLEMLGFDEVSYALASTDANIPLAAGVPTVCIGITRGGNAHRADEYIETEPVAAGLQQLLLLTLAAAHHTRAWSEWDNVG